MPNNKTTTIILARHRLHGGSEGRGGIKNKLLPGQWAKAVADGMKLKKKGLVPNVIVSSRSPDVVQTLYAISEGFAGEVLPIEYVDSRIGDTDEDTKIPKSLKKRVKSIALQKYGQINDEVYAQVRINDLPELQPHLLRRGKEGAACLKQFAAANPGGVVLVGTSGGSRFEVLLRTLRQLPPKQIIEYHEDIVPYGGIVLVTFVVKNGKAVYIKDVRFNF